MNSRKESFIGLASVSDLSIALHYKNAFKILYESDEYQDHIVIPALFMVRQFLELGLKYNIRKLKDISGSNNLVSKLLDTHDLEKLHFSFLEHYKCTQKNLKVKNLKDFNLIKDLKLLIKYILIFDNNSLGYRYSKDKKNNKIINKNETYNLETINELLENTSILLCNTEDIFNLANNTIE